MLARARELGLLTDARVPGAAGGELTDKARDVLGTAGEPVKQKDRRRKRSRSKEAEAARSKARRRSRR